MDKPPARLYEFGEYCLDVRNRLLLLRGKPLPLTPKSFDTLLLMVENSGRLVTKDEFLERLWPGTYVGEDTLAQNVSLLRKGLSEAGSGAEYISTVPKLGYRFVGQVRERGADSAAQGRAGSRTSTATGEQTETPSQVPEARGTALRPGPSTRKRTTLAVLGVSALLVVLGIGLVKWRRRVQALEAARGIRSIAVLPLDNLSGDPTQEYFTDGLTDELITDLARNATIRVISRTSVMQYKGKHPSAPEVARELNVDALVEGTVERVADRVRIRAQLIDARSDRHLWAQSYDRDVQNVLELQKKVARDIEEEIRVTLAPPELASAGKARPPSSEGYDDYLRGRYFWNQRTGEGMTKSIEYFNQAIKKDPAFALAYSGLADSYNMLGHWDMLAAQEAYPQAQAAALKALDLDNTLAQAHTSLGMTKMDFDWDFAGAGHEFDLALSLNPNYATAHQWRGVLFGVLGRRDESIAEERRALELDPLSPITRSTLAWMLYWAGRYDESIAESEKVLAVNPDFVPAIFNLGRVYVLRGKYDQAIAQFHKTGPGTAGSLGYAYALAGKRDEARKLLRELDRRSQTKHVTPDEFALIYMGLGEKERALSYLEKAYSERANALVYLRADARFDVLRAEPRFKDLVRRIGLPQ